MRIAYIIGKFPKLSESFIINQITGLIDMGHDVEIFAQSNPNEEKIHPDVKKYDLLKRTYYFKMPSGIIVRILKTLYLIATNFHKDPINILRSFNVLRYGRYTSNMRLLNLFIFFLTKKYDIIHCHFGGNGIIGVYLKELGVSGKNITSFHGADVNSDPKKYSSYIYHELFSKGDFFTANTNFTKQQLIKIGCPSNKIEIIPMGLNIKKFTFLEQLRQLNTPIRILTVGRLTEKKGHEYAIRAVAKVLQENKNILYTIAGDGSLRIKLQNLVVELGIEKYVRFTGQVDENEVLKLYSQTHIFLLPCVTAGNGDREGQGLVLQEAQAVGIPVISTFHNGIPEGILDGKSGFLVSERDINALADRISYLINHPEVCSEMGINGRRFVEERYDSINLNQTLINCYQRVLDVS